MCSHVLACTHIVHREIDDLWNLVIFAVLQDVDHCRQLHKASNSPAMQGWQRWITDVAFFTGSKKQASSSPI
jgi:hypothetical protein